MLIAGCALTRGLVLVTCKLREFGRDVLRKDARIAWIMVMRRRNTAARRQSHCDDSDDVLDTGKIGEVSRVQGQAVGCCRGGDEQVRNARTTGSSRCPCRSEQTAVHAGSFGFERERIPGRSRPLQPVLAPRAFLLIAGGMGSGSQLCQ